MSDTSVRDGDGGSPALAESESESLDALGFRQSGARLPLAEARRRVLGLIDSGTANQFKGKPDPNRLADLVELVRLLRSARAVSDLVETLESMQSVVGEPTARSSQNLDAGSPA